MNHHTAFTFIDLFAGIGGMRKGFESIGGKCVFTSERDIYAQTTYRAIILVPLTGLGEILQPSIQKKSLPMMFFW